MKLIFLSSALLTFGIGVAQARPPVSVKKFEVTTGPKYVPVELNRFFVIKDTRVWGTKPDLTIKAMEFTLIDIQKKELLNLKADLDELYKPERAGLFINGPTWKNRVAHAFSTFDVELIFYDPASQRAGLLMQDDFRDKQKREWKQHYTYLAWDFETNKIVWHKKIHSEAGSKAERYDEHLYSLGPNPDNTHLFFVASKKLLDPTDSKKNGAHITIKRLNLETHEIDYSYEFDSATNTNKNTHSGWRFTFSPDYSRLALAEYSEKGDKPYEPPPAAYVVDLKAKSHFSLPIPHTPYGSAIDKANQTLIIGSNQDRKFVVYNLVEKKKVRELKAPRSIHRLVLSANEKKLYVFSRGKAMEVRSWPALMRLKRILGEKVFLEPNSFAPDRSAVSHDRKWILLPPTNNISYPERTGVYIVSLDE
ncbi:MAG: hypothetical protein JRJ87_23465 [Deltaproteobacteria bacterium]|nr:hypothetical protein [Deltaproteobacteria bacterium]